MKTFHETFKDVIDMTDGTAVITEQIFKNIQEDARRDLEMEIYALYSIDARISEEMD